MASSGGSPPAVSERHQNLTTSPTGFSELLNMLSNQGIRGRVVTFREIVVQDPGPVPDYSVANQAAARVSDTTEGSNTDAIPPAVEQEVGGGSVEGADRGGPEDAGQGGAGVIVVPENNVQGDAGVAIAAEDAGQRAPENAEAAIELQEVIDNAMVEVAQAVRDDAVGVAGAMIPAGMEEDDDDSDDEVEMEMDIRTEFQRRLQQLSEERMRLNVDGPFSCEFENNGCTARFQSEQEMSQHVPNCVFGVMLYCDFCPPPHQVFRSTKGFVDHAEQMHQFQKTSGKEKSNIRITLDNGFLEPDVNGYNVAVSGVFEFLLEGQEVGLALGLMVHDSGVLHHRRVMPVPILYSPKGQVLHHLAQMTATLKDANGSPIAPIGYHGYNAGNVKTTTLSRAFKSTQEFAGAMYNLDSVVSYLHSDLLENGLQVYLDVVFEAYRCVINSGEQTPIAPIAFTWEDLGLEDNVRANMNNGALEIPSDMARILLPQFRGQHDFMIEAVDADEATDIVETGIFDWIVKLGPRTQHRVRAPLAIILYPTVSIMRRYICDWKRRAEKLDLKVYAFESYHKVLLNFWKRYDCDVVVLTPSILYDIMSKGESLAKEFITRNIKFVYYHHHHKNAFAEQQPKLAYCMQQIPIEESQTVRIAFTERISQRIIGYSSPPRITAQDEIPKTGMFGANWNQFSVGRDPSLQIESMREEHLPCTSMVDWVNAITDRIQNGSRKRWLIIGVRDTSHALETLKTRLAPPVFDEKRVTFVAKESEILCNTNFWEPFITREDSIIVGPYFLLDCAESENCDAIVFLTYPVHDADRVRVSVMSDMPNGVRKPVIAFPGLGR